VFVSAAVSSAGKRELAARAFVLRLWVFFFVGLLAASTGSGQVSGCTDGENLVLQDETLLTEETYSVCGTVTLGPNYEVAGPNGHLILYVGNAMSTGDNGLGDALSIGIDGRMAINMCIQIGDPAATCASNDDCCPAFEGDEGRCVEGSCRGDCLGPFQSDCFITPCCEGLICVSDLGGPGFCMLQGGFEPAHRTGLNKSASP
jgi:hypothetical protein